VAGPTTRLRPAPFYTTLRDVTQAAQVSRLGDLFEAAAARPNLPHLSALESEQEWLWSTKRRYFFEGRSEGQNGLQRPIELLPYRHLSRFYGAVAREEDEGSLLSMLLNGLARADGVPEDAVGDGLAFRLNAAAGAEVVVIKRFALGEFVLRRPKPDSRFVEALSDHLAIEHRKGAPRLLVTLDLFELLLRAHQGYLPGAEEQRAFYEDLAVFKDELLSEPSGDALLVEAGRQFHRVSIDDQRIRREELRV
jgi:hypothetical protein